jgi:hypothetical protein
VALCSDRCKGKFYNSIQRMKRAESHKKLCATCGRPFTGSRKDAKTCSPACRQKAYRQRYES